MLTPYRASQQDTLKAIINLMYKLEATYGYERDYSFYFFYIL